jgi:nucleoside-diphosphate-sugar epimerase
MKTLVTGHQGYIGSVLVRQLKEHGHQVAGLDSGFFADGTFGPDPIPPDRTIEKDVRRVEAEDLEGIDAVIHLAALSDDPMGELNPCLTDEINRRASVQLAQKAREAGVGRFLFSSSSSVYGLADVNVPVHEDSPTHPITAYAKSKVEAEKEMMQLAREDFSPVFLRNATAYGPSPRIRFCTLVVHNLLGYAMSTGKVLVKSDGSPWRPLVHVEDIGRAFLAALQAPKKAIHNTVFNVGQDSQNFQVKDIAEIVRRTVPGSGVECTGEHSADQRSYRVSFEKIAACLPGFQPAWDLEVGCEELYKFLRNNNFTGDLFEDRRFRRLKQVRHLMSCNLLDNDLFWVKGVSECAP